MVVLSKGLKELLLNVATVITTLVAMAVVVARLGAFSERVEVEATSIADWRQYSTEGARLGDSNPRVTIVEFSDFRCPHCRVAALTLRELRRRYPDDLALVYRHFPLQDVSLKAAIAAECANRVGAFEPLHDAFFEQADSLGRKPWTRFAWDVGIRDTLRFSACLNDTTAVLAVRRDVHAGYKLGVTGTPYLLINDQLFRGSPGLRVLERQIREALATGG